MDFIDVSKIPADEKVDDPQQQKGYQVQGVKDMNAARIVLIGEFKDMCDVRITSFNLKSFSCELVSCLLNEDMLKGDELGVLKILVSRSNGVIGRLLLRFQPKEEIKIGEELAGEFIVELYCEKGRAKIDTLKNFPGKDGIVPLFVKYMLDEDVTACLENS